MSPKPPVCTSKTPKALSTSIPDLLVSPASFLKREERRQVFNSDQFHLVDAV